MPFDLKHQLWALSREAMFESKKFFLKKQETTRHSVMSTIKHSLEHNYDEKTITAVQERYIFALQEKKMYNRTEQYLRSHQYEHHEPFHLFASNTELKLHLKVYSDFYGLNFS